MSCRAPAAAPVSRKLGKLTARRNRSGSVPERPCDTVAAGGRGDSGGSITHAALGWRTAPQPGAGPGALAPFLAGRLAFRLTQPVMNLAYLALARCCLCHALSPEDLGPVLPGPDTAPWVPVVAGCCQGVLALELRHPTRPSSRTVQRPALRAMLVPVTHLATGLSWAEPGSGCRCRFPLRISMPAAAPVAPRCPLSLERPADGAAEPLPYPPLQPAELGPLIVPFASPLSAAHSARRGGNA